MGRAPCCDKANVKKGPWSPEEDAKLKAYIEQHGTGGNWIALPQKIGLKRCGKSCRLRWLNYLRPNIKHGGFSEEEDNIICSLYISIGSRWSIIAAQLPGRTDNDIKNYWNTRLKKKFLGKQRKEKGRKGANYLKSGNANHSMVSSSNHHSNSSQTSYWPELPVLAPTPYSNQQHSFNDHASIRKLLIKLGGRFSSDDNQLLHNSTGPQLFPVDYFIPNNQPLYNKCIDNIPSSSSMEGVVNYNTIFGHHEFNEDGAVSTQTLQGQNIYIPAGFDQEMVNNNLEQKLDGLEFLGEDKMNNLMSATNEGTMINHCLEEMSSLIYLPQTDPNCSHDQEMQQRLMLQVQECDFVDEMVYQGLV